ncbi:hypothetical protein [Bdellovibrio sp. HCB2-146]|uniref:hypothetical protein n=1 Tax=Bdellovibrio sp. HCB2-146 TaxID=3394362 RepID=UPI0039BD67A3
MKTITSLLASLTLCFMASTASADGEQTPMGGSGTADNLFSNTEEKMSLPDFAERLATPTTESDADTQTYTCRAWTTCPGGYRISCWSRGYRCYSEATPGYRVYCSATSRSGYTKYWVYYCY